MSLLTTVVALSQQVKGTVKDENGKPVAGATISLLKASDSATIKLATTKENGDYAINPVTPGSYRISVSFVGHEQAYGASFEVEQADVQVPAITLTRSATATMKGVTITAKKPMVEVKADKTILNVEGTINAVGNDGLELLRKSPGVMVDREENLSLSGKNGVQVYIDGRPTPLAGKDLSNYLKSLQSAQIESIEIITNPSAKYEAAGNAGIINIKLKKNKTFGTNGSVNAGWNIGTFAKYNSGLTLNHRNGKLNIFGSYNYNRSRSYNYMNMFRETSNDSLFQQNAFMQNRNAFHGFKAGMDYFISKKSTIGIIANGNIGDMRFRSDSRTDIAHRATKNTDKLLIADSRNELDRENVNVNLNYRFADTAGHELNLDADYGYYSMGSNQFQPNLIYNASQTVLLGNETKRMLAPSEIDIYSFKADYEQPFKKGKLGLGGKLSYVNSNNLFTQLDVQAADKLETSNKFIYKENINAGYANYNRQLKGLMFQVGLRVEQTVAEGNTEGTTWRDNTYHNFSGVSKRNYTKFFPSAAVTFNKNPMNQFGVTYSRRIDRPAYQDLNPFEFRLDKYTYMRGNTGLQPQITNSVGITNTFRHKLNTTLNYSHVSDVFSQIIKVSENDRSKGYLTKENLATQDIVSLNVSYPFQYRKFSSYVNVNAYYSHYKADQGPNRKIDLDVVAATIFTQNSLKIGKTWTAEASAWLSTPTIWQGTFKQKNSMASVDLGVQKTAWNGKLNIKASVSDVFRTMTWNSLSNFDGQRINVSGGFESRQFKLSMNYRFGNTQVKAARQRKTAIDEESKRVNSGGSFGQ